MKHQCYLFKISYDINQMCLSIFHRSIFRVRYELSERFYLSGSSCYIVISNRSSQDPTLPHTRLSLDAGVAAPAVRCNAEALPFVSDHFDCITVGFGLRNVTHKEVALAEMR